ncbi:hypothetical protein BJ878DRAFT_535901 [Calycina marina]|uniref:Uncharacterized protein n=1 Tax=Calycina marina TaxID=1763456 RepID=A0A9P7Z069_9HELO|nr:hypothetical protein BJ878DRAFT_535901 [Calycina marina]
MSVSSEIVSSPGRDANTARETAGTKNDKSVALLVKCSAFQQQRPDLKLEKRVVRKLDNNFIPLLMRRLSYLDRNSFSTPLHMWPSFVVCCKAANTILHATATSWSGMMALRFFLGVYEAGYGTGVPYLLPFFYLRHEIGFHCGMFVSAAPHPGIANWRLLFIIDGLRALCMAAVTWLYFPDSPEKARFPNEGAKDITWVGGVRQICSEEPLYEQAGRSANLVQNCLSAPPYFFSFLLNLVSTYVTYHTQQRGYTFVFFSLLCAMMSALGSMTAVRYTGVCLAAWAIFTYVANILPWVLNNQGLDTKRGVGIAVITIGQCGPILDTNSYSATNVPYYRRGMWTAANKKMYHKQGPKAEKRDGGPTTIGNERDLTAQNTAALEYGGPSFRYIS